MTRRWWHVVKGMPPQAQIQVSPHQLCSPRFHDFCSHNLPRCGSYCFSMGGQEQTPVAPIQQEEKKIHPHDWKSPNVYLTDHPVKKTPELKTRRQIIWQGYSDYQKLESLHSCAIFAHTLPLLSPADEGGTHTDTPRVCEFPDVSSLQDKATQDAALLLTILCWSPDKLPSVFQVLGAKAPKHLLCEIQPNCSLDTWITFHFIWQEELSFPRCICDVFRPQFSHCLQILWINRSSFLLGNGTCGGGGGVVSDGLKKYSCPSFLRSGTLYNMKWEWFRWIMIHLHK